jgi:uncharacterized membrane protein YfcA
MELPLARVSRPRPDLLRYGAGALVLLAVAMAALADGPDVPAGVSLPAGLREAISASTMDPEYADLTREAIDDSAEPGFLGLPGAPKPGAVMAVLWAVWVGWIFSTVGAFGGTMAAVGHLTILGLGDYAMCFGRGSPVNAYLTDSIRVTNQWIVGLAAAISSVSYLRMGRAVLPLGLCLAVGAMAGSYLVPLTTAGKISLRSYIGIFGIVVLVMGLKLLYDSTPKAMARSSAASDAVRAYAASEAGGQVEITAGDNRRLLASAATVLAGVVAGNLLGGRSWMIAVGMIVLGLVILPRTRVRFSWCGSEFEFAPWLPALAGLVISAIAAFLGVGGGFLFVPFLTAVAGLPMLLAAGTCAVVIVISMTVSILSYMVAMGVAVDWRLVGLELLGVGIGAAVGARTSRFISEIWLKRVFVVLAVYVGLRYFSKGFLGGSWLPPF